MSAQGLGCMGMSQSYGEADEATSFATLHRALELGVTFWDTANVYGVTGRRRLRRQRAAARAGAGRPPRRGHPGHQDGDRRHQHRGAREHRAAVHAERHARRGAAPLRRVAGQARHRPHRPLLPAPRRPGHPDRGVDRRDGRARAGRQGPPRRCLGGDRRGARARARDPPDHRAAERVVAVDPRPRGRSGPDRAPARHRAGAVLAAGSRASSPVRWPGTRSPRATPAGRWRASPATTAPPTRPSSTRSPRWPRRTAHCPRQVALAWVLAQGAGRRPDPRHQAGRVPRAERRCPGHRRSPRTSWPGWTSWPTGWPGRARSEPARAGRR